MKFIPPPLTLERLGLIIRALGRRGGQMKRRDLNRYHGIEWWEIDQAEEQGFILTEKRKPKTGRPSEWAILAGRPTATHPFWEPKNPADRNQVSKKHPTKLPPPRRSFERRINRHEWDFAFWYVCGEIDPNLWPFGFRRRAWVAYMKAYPRCRSEAGARASASRLMKRPTTQAAIAWHFAKLDRCADLHRFFPETPTEIWSVLHRLGSQRAEWAPRSFRIKLARANHEASKTPPIFR